MVSILATEAAKSKNEKYDEMLSQMGGFGLFQTLTTMSFIVQISFGFFYFYPISFFELQPAYTCQTDLLGTLSPPYPCNTTQFCGHQNTTHAINYDEKFSFHNWIE